MSTDSAPFLAVAPSQPSRQCLAGDDGGAGLLWQCLRALRPGQLKKCLTTTWLASAWLRRMITCRGDDLGELLRRGDDDMRCTP
jgi:hypothetical protein